MKECDNSTRKVQISSNLVLSISLLIMCDTLLLRPSQHCNTPLHYTDRGKPKNWETQKKSLSATLPNPKRTDLKMKPSVRSERPVTNRVSHCTRPALHYIWIRHRQVAMANELFTVLPKICGSQIGTCCMYGYPDWGFSVLVPQL